MAGRRIAISLLVALLLTAAVAPLVRAQSGPTDFDLSLPDLVILHYFSAVDLTVTSNLLRNTLFRNGGYPARNHGTQVGSGLVPDLGIDGVYDNNLGPRDADNINVRLRNLFAVRALGGPGRSVQVGVALAGDTGVHTSDAGSSLQVSNPRVTISGRTGATVTIAPPGLVNPASGEVRLVLDLSGVQRSGTYSGIVVVLSVDNL